MNERRLEINATKRNLQTQPNSTHLTNSFIENHSMNISNNKSKMAHKNLANLRDILKATHEMRNQPNTQKLLNQAEAQFIRSTNNEPSKKSSAKLATNKNDFESSQIDKDLQESIRLLKEYDCNNSINKSSLKANFNKLQSNHFDLNENDKICNQSRLSDSFTNLLDLIAEQENNRTNMDNRKNLLQNNNYNNDDEEDFMTKRQSNKQIRCDDSPMKLLQQQRREHETTTTSLIRNNMNSEKPINPTTINQMDKEEKKRNSFNSARLNIEEKNTSKCDETNSCFNRNDLTRKNLTVKWDKESKMLNKSLSIVNNANSDNNNNKQEEKNTEMQSNESTATNEPKASDSERHQLFRHSMRQSNRKSTSEMEEKMDRVKQSTSFSYEKSDESLKLKPATWKYDELNELRMKFISLLSSNSNTSSPTRLSTSSSSTAPSSCSSAASPVECKESESAPGEKSDLNVEAERAMDSQISCEDLSKIESFYRSFGTTLYLANSSANLYTLPLSQTHLESKSDESTLPKRPQSVSFQTEQAELDPKILTDFMENKHNPLNTNVYHRGVPLWLFNSGINPRRPNKQLKFTLAERGTGFILWQDRVDNYSDLKFYSMRRKDGKLVDFAAYHEKLTLSFDLNEQTSKMSDKEVCSLFSSMLITFKASDKKTRVFIKFDLNLESVKFYEHFVQQFKHINNDIKQRTKSLPIGVTLNTRYNDAKSIKSFTMDAKNSFQANLAISQGQSNFTRASNKNNNKLKNRLKRQSCHIVQFLKPSQNVSIGTKKITKNDISHPCNPIHVTSIRTNERNSFYTLSKLLPIFDNHNVDSSSSCMHSSAKSSPSPTSSLTSSSCSSASSPQNSSNLSDSTMLALKELKNPLPILLTSSSCFMDNTQKSTNQSSPTSSSSSSSLSSVPPIMFTRNSNELQSKQQGAQHSFNNKKPLLSKQKTLK